MKLTITKLVLVSLFTLQFFFISKNIIEYEKIGMDIILHIQDFRSTPLDIAMRIASIFGFEFFIVLVPLLAWWGDRRLQKLGANLFVLLLLILFMVSCIKVFYSRPRPLSINDKIGHYGSEDKIEFSYPSGHAWASSSFFFLAKSFKGPQYWIAATLMCSITMFSRLYFGVHYPHDLVAGLICGVISIILFTFVEKFLEALFAGAELTSPDLLSKESRSERRRRLFINWPNMISLVLFVVTSCASFLMTEEQRRRQQGLVFVPYCLMGFILSKPFIPSLVCDSSKFRLLRMLVGIPIIFSLFLMFRVLGASMRPLLAVISGAWLFAVAPVIFLKLGLTKSQHNSNKIE